MDFIRQQFWDHIPPTGIQAIEKLMAENDELKERFLKLEEKVTNLVNEVNELKSKVCILIHESDMQYNLYVSYFFWIRMNQIVLQQL